MSSSNLITAFPLCWPTGWKRTPNYRRVSPLFHKKERRFSDASKEQWFGKSELTIADSVTRLLDELERLGAARDKTIVSTNVKVKPNGLPYSDTRKVDDPGAAVYWVQRGETQTKCMAVDRYSMVAGNIAAIAATIAAMRAIKRHGSAEILDRVFTGFAQLPPPMTAGRPWWDVLQFICEPRTLADAEEKYRLLAKEHHPDVGGDVEKFKELNEAIRQARAALS